MFPQLLRSLVLVVLSIAIFAAHVRAQQATASVTASVSVFQNTNKEVVYKISYSYEFVGVNTIFIDGVGLVPSRGRLAYYSYDSKIVFRESMGGRVLALFSLIGSDVYTSVGAGPDFPDESEFSKTYRSGLWAFSSSFRLIANEALNKSFPSGYRAYSADSTNYLQTSYAPLKDLPSNLLGQIAILLSHPYNVRNKDFEYRIQFVVREKRIQSGRWRYEIGEEVRKSAEDFINHLIGKLEEEGRKRK